MPPRTSNDPVAAAFGNAVKAARNKRELTVDDLARKIPRIDSAYLHAIEQGAHAITVPTAHRIAAGLGISLSELVADLGPDQEQTTT